MEQDQEQEKKKEDKPGFQRDQVKSALIFGAGHGIGYALVENLIKNTESTVHATYRSKEKAHSLFDLKEQNQERLQVHELDPIQESQVSELALKMENEQIKPELMINCVGLLHNDEIQPERKLSEIEPKHLSTVFQVNAFVTPIIAKHFLKNKRTAPPTPLFAAISAKVGSLNDNRMGGWYSYRASKAALNMFIKNIALELKRHRDDTVVLAIHPGTTETQLSEPFIQRTNLKLHSPQETAENIFKLIEGKGLKETGGFFSWDGEQLDW